MAYRDLISDGAQVVPLTSERLHYRARPTGLFEQLSYRGVLSCFAGLDGAGWHLDAGLRERDPVVREHEEVPVTDDLADDLVDLGWHESTVRPHVSCHMLAARWPGEPFGRWRKAHEGVAA